MQATKQFEKFIDLEEVIRKKNPALLKKIPSFILRYLKRIVHEDDMNRSYERIHVYDKLDFVRESLIELGVKYESFGFENVPDKGRYIFAANHPLGGLDGMILVDQLGKKFNDIKFVANDILMNVKNVQSFFLPINKHGKQTQNYARLIEETYLSEAQVLYFPAGLVSRRINGQITDLTWQKSFITKAVQYKRDVIPVYFEGRNSNFFYRLANLRKFLGIKVNIEMLYLVDEMYRQRNKNVRLVFGKPISYKTFDKSKTTMEWAAEIKNKVYLLKNEL